MWLIVPLIIAQHVSFVMIIILSVLFTNPYWALLHEGIHRVFHPSKQINDFLCRAMAISFGTVFYIVRYGHLMHHRMNRKGPDLIDAYCPKKEKKWVKNIHYYSYILGGLYLSELCFPLLTFLPKKWLQSLLAKTLGVHSSYYQTVCSNLLRGKTLHQCRLDAVLLYSLVMVSFLLYGSLWWVLCIALLIRGFLISFADNLPHYGTTVDDPTYALNTRMPKYLSKSLFYFNLHRIHHQHPTLPWSELKNKLEEKQDQYDTGYFAQAIRQLKGVWPKIEEKQG